MKRQAVLLLVGGELSQRTFELALVRVAWPPLLVKAEL